MKNTDTMQGRRFDDFILSEREKNIKLIRHRYSLSTQEAEDIVSDAITDLYVSRSSGRPMAKMLSLAAYFTKMCLNKCFRFASSSPERGAVKSIDDDVSARLEADRVARFLDSVEGMSADAVSVMRRIVADLPSPCDKILWAYYEDGLSMKDIAALTGLKDDLSAKSTKSNCISKLKNRYFTTLQSIKNGEI